MSLLVYWTQDHHGNFPRGTLLILSHVWGDDEASEREYIHVYINRLRKKIETPAQRRFIYNEPKVGYRFQADD